MPKSPVTPAPSSVYPSPPRVHWSLLLLALICAEALAFRFVPETYRSFAIYAVAVAWPLYLCLWIRKIDHRSSSLYWAIASLVTGFGFLFSWLLWIVVIYELREELLDALAAPLLYSNQRYAQRSLPCDRLSRCHLLCALRYRVDSRHSN